MVQSFPHRRSAGKPASRSGATLFLSYDYWTSSGAHYDENHSLLVSLAGKRLVWVSRATWPMNRRFMHSPWALKPPFDPATASVESVREGWTKWELSPGDAIFLPRGMWHSVLAPPGSVALSIEVRNRFDAQPSLRIWQLTYNQLDEWNSASNVEDLFAAGEVPERQCWFNRGRK